MQKSTSCPSLSSLATPAYTTLPKKKRSMSSIVKAYDNSILPYYYTSIHNAALCVMSETKDTDNNESQMNQQVKDLAYCLASPPELAEEDIEHVPNVASRLLRLRQYYFLTRRKLVEGNDEDEKEEKEEKEEDFTHNAIAAPS